VIGELTLSQLIADGLTLKRLSAHFEVSQTTVRYYVKKYGLRLRRGTGGKRDKQLLNESRYCKVCGERDPSKFYGHKVSMCGACHAKYTLERGHEKRRRALECKGSRCESCGFAKYIASLDFHHLNPSEKDPNFGNWRGWAWCKIEEEIKKCVLLCRNCHAAVHSGELILGE
jgi:DNA-binding CsgD family transcriptional regulator